MLKELTKCVLNGVSDVGVNEFKLFYTKFVKVDKAGNDNKPCSLSIKECGFSIKSPVSGKGAIIIKMGNVSDLIDNFRFKGLLESKDSLIGMELKRGCQYNREWIADLIFDEDNRVIVKSSSGECYDSKNIRVYKDEENVSSIFDFSAYLKISDGAGAEVLRDG